MYQQVAGDKYAFADNQVLKGTYEYAVKGDLQRRWSIADHKKHEGGNKIR